MSKKIGVITIFIGFIMWLVGAVVCYVLGENISFDTGAFSFIAIPGALLIVSGILVFAYNKIFTPDE